VVQTYLFNVVIVKLPASSAKYHNLIVMSIYCPSDYFILKHSLHYGHQHFDLLLMCLNARRKSI